MRLNFERFRALVAEQGVDAEQLAGALPEETGRRKERSGQARKIRNWLMGRDHPKAKRAEIEAIAGVLGVEPAVIARFTSRGSFVRSSPRKSRLSADLIRGRDAVEAQTLLAFNPRRSSWMVKKVLDAAIADAEAHDVSPDRLIVAESRVDEGVIIKRFRPKDRGRAHPIQKKTSHIVVGVEERS